MRVGKIMTVYTRSLKIHADVLDDLKLVKRVLGKDSLSETIRFLMDARGYDKKWVSYMLEVLGAEEEISKK